MKKEIKEVIKQIERSIKAVKKLSLLDNRHILTLEALNEMKQKMKIKGVT